MNYYQGNYQGQFYQSQYEGGADGQMGGASTSGGVGGGSSGDYGYDGGMLSTGILAALGTSGYPGEPPLLEELGVNFGHIKTKTLTVLNPFRSISQHIMDDSDLAGPILFCLMFGTFLLLSGKVHFGYIYGVALVGTVSLHWILTLMATDAIDFVRTASVLGYCLLPLVVVCAFGIFIRMDGPLGFALSVLSVVWCTYSSSAIFVSVLRLSDMRALVAYPLALFYGIFSIMSIFAEKVDV